jgi:hypothetical protein
LLLFLALRVLKHAKSDHRESHSQESQYDAQDIAEREIALIVEDEHDPVCQVQQQGDSYDSPIHSFALSPLDELTTVFLGGDLSCQKF